LLSWLELYSDDRARGDYALPEKPALPGYRRDSCDRRLCRLVQCDNPGGDGPRGGALRAKRPVSTTQNCPDQGRQQFLNECNRLITTTGFG
jgi:hypothetical protein